MQLRGHILDPRSGLITGDFTISMLPLWPGLAHKDSARVIGISCRDALSVRVGFRACFLEMGALSACLGFFYSRVFRLRSAWQVPFFKSPAWDRGQGGELGVFAGGLFGIGSVG